jgi:hypothetical protein
MLSEKKEKKKKETIEEKAIIYVTSGPSLLFSLFVEIGSTYFKRQ